MTFSPVRSGVSRRAFTLLELIVAIVILGILAALAIPTFASVIERSRDKTTVATLQAIGREAATLAAFDQNGFRAEDVTAATSETAYVAMPGTFAAALTPVNTPGKPLAGEVRWHTQDGRLGLSMPSGSGDVCAVAVSKAGTSQGSCLDATMAPAYNPSVSVLTDGDSWESGPSSSPQPETPATIVRASAGVNYAPNPGAEAGLSDFNSLFATPRTLTSDAHTGTQAVHYSNASATTGNPEKVWGAILSQPTSSLQPAGTPVRSGAWVKGTAGMQVIVSGRPSSSSGLTVSASGGIRSYTTTGEWQYIQSDAWTFATADFHPNFQIRSNRTDLSGTTDFIIIDDIFTGRAPTATATWPAVVGATSYEIYQGTALLLTTTETTVLVPVLEDTIPYQVVAKNNTTTLRTTNLQLPPQ